VGSEPVEIAEPALLVEPMPKNLIVVDLLDFTLSDVVDLATSLEPWRVASR
jgi:hypothetical protein